MAKFVRETEGIEVVKQLKDEVEGKTILITGTSASGLGAETAISLAHANPAHLVLLARSENKVKPVITKIHQLNSSIKVSFVAIELDDLDSVRKAADAVNSSIHSLDILINNAGIMALPRFETNKSGIEMQFATNHLGHFLLTGLLLPKLLAAGKNSRVINLTSDGHAISDCRYEDYNFKNGAEYDMWSGYGQSKTANLLFTRALAAKLSSKGILSFAVHPGVIFGTQLVNNVEDQERDFALVGDIALKNTGRRFIIDKSKSIQQGVTTTLVAALDPGIAASSGSYWVDARETEPFEYAASDKNAQKIWELSEKLVGFKFDL